MKPPFRLYRVGHGLYYMKPLTFGEHLRVTALMKAKLGVRPGEEVSIAQLLDVLYDQGGVRDLVMIVVKPLFSWVPPIGEVLEDIGERKVSRILSDFFVLNPGWLVRLTNLALWMAMSKQRRELLLKLNRIHLNRSSPLQGETLQMPN